MALWLYRKMNVLSSFFLSYLAVMSIIYFQRFCKKKILTEEGKVNMTDVKLEKPYVR